MRNLLARIWSSRSDGSAPSSLLSDPTSRHELSRRREAWVLLSDLWLDTEINRIPGALTRATSVLGGTTGRDLCVRGRSCLVLEPGKRCRRVGGIRSELAGAGNIESHGPCRVQRQGVAAQKANHAYRRRHMAGSADQDRADPQPGGPQYISRSAAPGLTRRVCWADPQTFIDISGGRDGKAGPCTRHLHNQ